MALLMSDSDLDNSLVNYANNHYLDLEYTISFLFTSSRSFQSK